ncbi:hypothetical protein [Sphingomonas oryzagri]|uniref:Circumsporozoite protein n=1 Tax=Sphingomonas oryzagri TaxID=3042314 RepID=A0ABT6MYC1_9SPHN|nr:hypothetical protein [Sphingomonas oryzagri]MDH7637489.1 hypothetical protein [Sphingomonas oryzagri]
MRTLSKIATSTVVIAGALLVAACGHSDNTAATDTNMTNMDTMDSSAGMTNDASALDATANDATAPADANAAAPAENASNAM